jgi:hypothetical protein
MLAALALTVPLGASAQTYRCDVGGRVVFQQQPCNDGKRVDGTASSAPNPAATAAPRGAALCEAHVRSAATFADPESVRIGGIQYLGAKPWKLHQELIAARTYGLRVNARNGYGAYEGERLYECLLSEDEARVLHFRPAGR